MQTALIIVELVLFIILLLLLPIRVEARGILSLRTSRLWIQTRLFGLIPIKLKFRLNLFEHPYFTLQQLKRNGRVKDIPLLGGGGSRVDIKKILQSSHFRVKFIVGIKDDAALTVFCIGALNAFCCAASELLMIPAEIGEEAAFDKNVFRVKIFGITKVNLANIIHIVKKKRGKKHAPR